MSIVKIALALSFAAASASATAAVVHPQSESAASAVSTCYYQYSIITNDGVYDVYTCYSNGDGSY